jgi:hypothetical protein
MGIHCDTTLCSGPRAVVAGEWRAQVAEARAGFGSEEEHAESDEEENVDTELTAYQQWQAEQPHDVKDNRALLRPYAAKCRNWSGRVGSCSYGQGCHFRHDTDARDRPEFEEWRARNPGGPQPKLTTELSQSCLRHRRDISS